MRALDAPVYAPHRFPRSHSGTRDPVRSDTRGNAVPGHAERKPLFRRARARRRHRGTMSRVGSKRERQADRALVVAYHKARLPSCSSTSPTPSIASAPASSTRSPSTTSSTRTRVRPASCGSSVGGRAPAPAPAWKSPLACCATWPLRATPWTGGSTARRASATESARSRHPRDALAPARVDPRDAARRAGSQLAGETRPENPSWCRAACSASYGLSVMSHVRERAFLDVAEPSRKEPHHSST